MVDYRNEDGDQDKETLMYTRVARDIYINKNLTSSSKELDEYFESLPAGYLPVNVSLRGIASHEIGHCLESYILHKRESDHPGTYSEDAWSESVIAREIVRKAYSSLQTNQSLDELRMEISKYSISDYAETIAEAANDFLTNGSNAQQLSKEIVKIIKEEIK